MHSARHSTGFEPLKVAVRRFGSALAALALLLTAILAPASLLAAPRSVDDDQARRRLQFGPAGDWVIETEVDWDAETPDGENGGRHHLLLDVQIDRRGEGQARYTRHVTRVLTEQGAAKAARLTVVYDPSYQTLVIHGVWLHRNGVRHQRLDPDRVELLRREPGLSSELYDGERTALLLLEDVRVGDVIETSRTLHGINPALDDRLSTWINLQWSTPLVRRHFRGLWPADSPPQVRVHRSDLEPERRVQGGLLELSWTLRDVPALNLPAGLPDDSEPWPQVQISEWKSWAEVADWGTALFSFDEALSEDLLAAIEPLSADGPPRPELVRRVLRLVQDDVRYLGLEFGPHGYQPSDPGAVYRRRYGDCKDKSILLVSLLRHLGFEVHPALVNTMYGSVLDRWLPTATAFDHAIVRLELDGETYWLDPTRLHQRGPLERRFSPHFGWALVLDRGVAGLQRTKARGSGRTRVHESYVSTGVERPVTLAIVTTYEDGDADSMRSYLAREALEDVRSGYADYYASVYTSIVSSGPLEIEDDEVANRLIVTERYDVPDFWTDEDGSGAWSAELWDLQLDSIFDVPPAGPRTLPLAWSYPRDLEIQSIVNLHEVWLPETNKTEVVGPAFRLEVESSYSGKVFKIRRRYRATAEVIAAEDVDRQREAIADARGELGYGFWVGEDGGDSTATGLAEGMNWSVLLVVLFSFVAFSFVAVVLYRLRRPPPLPTEIDPSLTGLRGWLIVPMLGVVVRPFGLLVTIVDLLPSYALSTWHALTTPGSVNYHPAWAPFLLFEAVANIYLFVGALLIFVAFFKRKRVLPMLMIVYLISLVVVTGLDETLALLLDLEAEDAALPFVDFARSLIYAVVWCSYFAVSKRVKSTFVR